MHKHNPLICIIQNKLKSSKYETTIIKADTNLTKPSILSHHIPTLRPLHRHSVPRRKWNQTPPIPLRTMPLSMLHPLPRLQRLDRLDIIQTRYIIHCVHTITFPPLDIHRFIPTTTLRNSYARLRDQRRRCTRRRRRRR